MCAKAKDAEKAEETRKKAIEDYVRRIEEGRLDSKLTDENLKTLKEKMLKSLEFDVQKLVSSEKFISGIVLRMPIVPVRDCRVDTACTDGSRIYFDIDFYTKLNRSERIFVLAHEVWHNALLHFLRRENRDSDLWNIATDCEINYALHEDGFVMPSGLCYPCREDEGKCAEDIYERLLRHQKKKAKGGKGSTSSSGGTTGEGFSTTGGDNRNESESGEIKGQFDKHIERNDCEDGNVDFETPRDKWGEKGFDEDFKPCISDEAADKIREMVVSESQRYERTKGSVPSCVKRIIDSICTPEVKWEELLSQFVTSCLGDRRQWLPPLRRGVYSGMYFQSRRGEKISVTCIVDTSGSTTTDLPKFLSELASLLDTFGRYELTVVHCDCAVHRVDTFDESNPFPVDNPMTYDFDGGGGSDLGPAFEEVVKRGIESSCIVVFTDGYIDCPKENPTGIPTLFVLTADGHDDLCDWGKKIRFRNRGDN